MPTGATPACPHQLLSREAFTTTARHCVHGPSGQLVQGSAGDCDNLARTEVWPASAPPPALLWPAPCPETVSGPDLSEAAVVAVRPLIVSDGNAHARHGLCMIVDSERRRGGLVMSGHSHCQECGNKLGRRAVFCPHCGRSCCSWECQERHATRHAEEPRAPQHPGNPEARAADAAPSR